MNLVVIQNRQAVTTSLQVAKSFEKEHRNVLRDIEGLLKNEQTQNYFYKGTYEHPQNKQEYPMYYMNRDGFTLLAMGFTGKKAMEFKLQYIQAFNQMEQLLKNNSTNLDEKKIAFETHLIGVEYTSKILRVDEITEKIFYHLKERMFCVGGGKALFFRALCRFCFMANHFSRCFL